MRDRQPLNHRVYLAVITATLLAAFSLVPRAVGAQSGWTTKAPMLIARTAGVALTGQDGRIFVFGGTDGVRNFVSAEVYTPSADSWSPIASLPIANSYMAGTLGSDGKMYLVGGWDGHSSQNDLVAYDPATNTYACSFSHVGCASSNLAPLPTARSNLAVTLGTDGLIYAVGGYTTQPVATVEAYDVLANHWHPVTPLPHPSAGLGAITDSDGTFYVSGGFDGQNYLSTLYAGRRVSMLRKLDRIRPLDRVHGQGVEVTYTDKQPKSDGSDATKLKVKDFGRIRIQLSELKDVKIWTGGQSKTTASSAGGIPTASWPYASRPRAMRASAESEAQANNSGYAYVILGGTSGGPATNAVAIYDPGDNTVYSGQPMPTARESEMAAVGADGTIYVIGGDNGSGSNPFSSMDAWVPPPAPAATPTNTPTSPPTPTSTATPVPAKPTTTPKRFVSKPCAKHAKRKRGKCACQKGYKLVHGKCKKVKKHH